ncbi:glutamate-5-semialdehyde dehydrogenase [Acetobacter sp. AN02]|uniref:glutamate-5-semialdehyde dehydrogenase n=1 Tax=Acetobacter sp. AN02 TaxID=2894186 RepID=UPI0024343846|nr:glutamate-5-semialdehyde dehydrogenase [Acetobacter sp. AN02]MDG6094332.1 glutamate-5-semialdehyde dehydrogenase [Acetobacter sp. AN02]
MSATAEADRVTEAEIPAMAREARQAVRDLAQSPSAARDRALWAAAAALREQQDTILAANARDLESFSGTDAFRDRLVLTPERIEVMATGLENIADLPDPVGRVLAEWSRPNGLKIRRVAAPVGVIGVIYESRPNVGADAAGLAIKSGNAVILRGGSESIHSATAINSAMKAGLSAAGLPEACVQMAPDADRRHVADMLAASGLIDLLIPRGGKSLVERVQREARVPVLAHAEGLCHTYIHAAAEPPMARRIIANAKMRRTGICGATETLLIDAEIAPSLLPLIVEDLRALGCDFRADERARNIVPGLSAATEADFATEWLDATLSVAVVDGIDAALDHIVKYGSAHTEAIITSDEAAAARFLNGTDSAVVMWNASTQFCDGGEFGFGAEIGIATGRFHARGPVGLEQLTTFRYEVIGTGQVRS